MAEWYETSAHHFVVDKQGKLMGGQPFDESIKAQCLKEM